MKTIEEQKLELSKYFTGARIRVCHLAQIPCEAFIVEVENELEAVRLSDILAKQHLFLYKEDIIEDYSNVLCVEMYSSNHDGEGNPGWGPWESPTSDLYDFEEFETIVREEYPDLIPKYGE